MEKNKKVYMIVETQINDKDKYLLYVEKAKPIVESFGGSYLVQTNDVYPISGDWNPERIIVIEFPSREQLKSCFSSDSYKEIGHLRKESVISKAIAVESL